MKEGRGGEGRETVGKGVEIRLAAGYLVADL